MRRAQLSLVLPEAPSGAVDSAEQRVFAHWVFLMGKNPRRTVLSPERLRLIRKALELYEEETLQLAIEGCAASPFHRGQNDRDTKYDDIELILRSARYVERFAEMGEAVRERLERERQREAARAAALSAAPAAAEPAHAARTLQALKSLTDRLAKGGRGG